MLSTILLLVAMVASSMGRHELELLNNSEETIFCWWKNPETKDLVHSGTLSPGTSLELQTDIGHEFIIAGESGRSYGTLIAKTGVHSHVVETEEARGSILRNDHDSEVILYKLNHKDGQLVRLGPCQPNQLVSVTSMPFETILAADRNDRVVFMHDKTKSGHIISIQLQTTCDDDGCHHPQTLDALPGYAPALFKSHQVLSDDDVQDQHTVGVLVFPNGGNNTGTEPSFHIDIPVRGDSVGLDLIKEIVGPVCHAVTSRHPERLDVDWKDTFDVFDRYGRMLQSSAALKDGDMLFVVPQTDYFFWPGMYPGYSVTLPWIVKPDGQPVTLVTKTLQPRLFAIDDYISDEMAEATIEWAAPHLHDSGVVKDGKLGQMDSARTSKTAWIPSTTVFLKPLFNMSAALTQLVDSSLYEPLQFLRYEGDGKHRYEAHHDYFGEDTNDSQRLITLFIYFTDNPGEGHTVFPRAQMEGTDQEHRPTYGVGAVPSMADCTHGYASYPVKKRAVLWYNLKPRGHMSQPTRVDFRSLHGACPANNSAKIGANHWIHNVRVGGVVPKALPKLRTKLRVIGD